MQNTQHHAGWKYTVTALALSVAMAPVAQAASVLNGTGKLELKRVETNRETQPAGRVVSTVPTEILATKTNRPELYPAESTGSPGRREDGHT